MLCQRGLRKGKLHLDFVCECLNTSLQKGTGTVAGMRSAIECVRSTVHGKRKKSFHEVFVQWQLLSPLGLSPFKFLTKESHTEVSQHTPKSAKEHYRTEFYKMLDSVGETGNGCNTFCLSSYNLLSVHGRALKFTDYTHVSTIIEMPTTPPTISQN